MIEHPGAERRPPCLGESADHRRHMRPDGLALWPRRAMHPRILQVSEDLLIGDRRVVWIWDSRHPLISSSLVVISRGHPSAALDEAHWVAMQRLHASSRDPHQLTYLYSHTLVWRDHVRLDHNGHVLGKDKTRMACASCLSCTHVWGEVAPAESVQ